MSEYLKIDEKLETFREKCRFHNNVLHSIFHSDIHLKSIENNSNMGVLISKLTRKIRIYKMKNIQVEITTEITEITQYSAYIALHFTLHIPSNKPNTQEKL